MQILGVGRQHAGGAGRGWSCGQGLRGSSGRCDGGLPSQVCLFVCVCVCVCVFVGGGGRELASYAGSRSEDLFEPLSAA
jgi:hypothetical protein